MVDDNARSIIDQNQYITKYDGYINRFEKTKVKLEKLQEQRRHRLAKCDSIGAFMFEISERDEIITKFDERLFVIVVERIVVSEDGLTFEFKNGIII